MKKRTLSLVTMMASLALASPLYATDSHQKTTMTNQNNELSVSQSQSQSADKLLGMTIESKEGKKLGEIQDLKIDTGSGRINYITAQVGGVMGIGGKDGVAVPLEAFRFADDKAILTVDQSKLNDVPKRSDVSDADFQRDLESHYGVSPAWRDNSNDASSGMNTGNSSNLNNPAKSSNHMNNIKNQQHKKMDPLQDTSDNQKSQ